MKIIYAKKSSGIDEQGSFQNPEYYLKPESNAQLVVIYGEYPHIKTDYEELGINVEVRELPKAKPLTVDLKVGITPELQKVIDQAKAECEKVVAENVELKDQLVTSKGEFMAFRNDVDAMKKSIAELEPVVDKKPTAAELKAAKAAEATEPTKE
ncbi:hypothetical protein [Acinetobacter sp. 1207_04]|uniref:hypothetical protein n=1 Tax=Acinetobacter sp. 1207_04 TaxID=2604449 RepID=UPI00405863E3